MSHMSVLGACWAQAYFEKKPIFGKEDIILEHVQRVEKTSMQKNKENEHGGGRETWQAGRKT
jgi:hypothetical protein